MDSCESLHYMLHTLFTVALSVWLHYHNLAWLPLSPLERS